MAETEKENCVGSEVLVVTECIGKSGVKVVNLFLGFN